MDTHPRPQFRMACKRISANTGANEPRIRDAAPNRNPSRGDKDDSRVSNQLSVFYVET